MTEKGYPERYWLIKSPWGYHPQSTKPTKSEGVEYVRADLLTTTRLEAVREARERALKDAIAIIVGQPTAHYIYSGAQPMAAETFRDNAVKSIEVTIAIEKAKIEAATNKSCE